MECAYNEIDKKFSDYILKLVGPSDEQDQIRELKFKQMKSVLERTFLAQGIIAHVFSFGSFPFRTYLPESDIDITIVIEDSLSHQIITINNSEYQNKIFNLIQFGLESHNNEVGFQQISEITLIPAEVKLIKCKFDNLAFDISINNFVGLCKLSFMSQLEAKFSNNLLLKRSLFLIKSWSYYEAGILGSNVGLMSSYALEILILYMFNNFSHLFNNEIEAVLTFFQVMHETDCNKKIFTISGSLDIDVYYEKLKNNNYNLNLLIQSLKEENNEDKHIITLDDLILVNKHFEKFDDSKSNKKVIDAKLVNIIDPLFQTNNLGKSLNFHNYSKLTKIFEISADNAAKLIKIKQEKVLSPLQYFNSLSKIFSKVITIRNSELFKKYLLIPKILIDYSIKNHSESQSNLFQDENNIEDDENEEELLSKVEIEKIINGENSTYSYNFKSSEEISIVEDYLFKQKSN